MVTESLNKISYRKAFCNDFDQFSDAASKWSLDFKQLDSGKFKGEFALLDLGNLLLANIKLNRQIEQNSVSPKGFKAFGMLANPNQSFIWRGHTVNGNNLLISPKSRHVEAICYPGFDLFTVYMKNGLVEEYFDIQQCKKSTIPNTGFEVLRLPSDKMNFLRAQIQRLFIQVGNETQIINNELWRKNVKEEITESMLSQLIQDSSVVNLPPKRIRDIALTRALDCILNSCLEWPTVDELCIISGASKRTLEYAFKEKYGFGPKIFMKRLRLNDVHKQLRKADPKISKISDIAHDSGFWHMGQFSADYKYLFGELPSTTLGKVKTQPYLVAS